MVLVLVMILFVVVIKHVWLLCYFLLACLPHEIGNPNPFTGLQGCASQFCPKKSFSRFMYALDLPHVNGNGTQDDMMYFSFELFYFFCFYMGKELI